MLVGAIIMTPEIMDTGILATDITKYEKYEKVYITHFYTFFLFV